MGLHIVNEITIEKLAHGGDGLAHLPDGRVLFVRGAVPGDVVDVEIVRQKKSWARGHVVGRSKDSDARVPVECEAFERGCGGCQFWGVDYRRELEWKVQAAREAMQRISGLDLPAPSVEEAPSVNEYRSRVTYHQRRTDDSLLRGFYQQGSRRVVTVDSCPVARSAIDEAIAELGGALDLIGKADITVETAGAEGAVVLAELGPGERIKRDDLEELARRIEQGTAVRGMELLDEEGEYYIIGDTTVCASEVLARPPLKGLRVESGRFRQANTAVNRQLVDYVTGLVSTGWEKPRIVELFCGAGNFSFPLASVAEQLVGFEVSSGAVQTARQLSELAEDVENTRFEVADLTDEDVVSETLREPFEVLVLDPPREGAKEVARQLVESQRKGQIIYIACDAACVARDLKILHQGGWSVDSIKCFDMFPRTAHLETVVVAENV